jgi:hypothetical protein
VDCQDPWSRWRTWYDRKLRGTTRAGFEDRALKGGALGSSCPAPETALPAPASSFFCRTLRVACITPDSVRTFSFSDGALTSRSALLMSDSLRRWLLL